MSRWPNLFIVGAPKAGTHSLYELLKQHPSVYMSPRKEPYFFCRDIIADDDEFCNPIRDEKEYLKLFEDSKDEEILGEATVSYLADPNAAKRIKEKIPHAKILIILRNPADRAFSQYLGLLNHGFVKSPFSKAIEEDLERIKKNQVSWNILFGGFYFEQISRYMKIFNDQQLKIIILDDFKKEPKKIMDEITKFLSIKKFDFVMGQFGEYKPPRRKIITSIIGNKIITNVGKQIFSKKIRKSIFQNLALKDKEKPIMSIKDREKVNKIYKEDIEKTENLLSRKLFWI